MKKFKFLLIPVVFTIVSAFIPTLPEEGMFPLNEIRQLDLKEYGLQIDIDEVYNPDGASLVDALVNVGGCSGSFVSAEGLMITNHHCTFGAVQTISTTDNNYLEEGFLARTREEEIPAVGLTCRITVSYEDVSERILKAAETAEDINKRIEAIQQKMSEIIKEEEATDPTIEARVSEMFTGESYVLFRYRLINDVRLVYVPPVNIGNFGAETDNWEWPRHTGDFTFIRAYVAPDGSSAAYSPDNVPFTPKRYIQVNPDGVNEGDFVFLLGYPGRTFKNQPSYFIEHHENYQLPFIQRLYEWIIKLYDEASENDPEFALATSTRVKNLANVEKNYRGKMQGMNRLNLVERKKEEERELQRYIDSNTEMKKKYGNTLNEIRNVYQEIFNYGVFPFVMRNLSQNVNKYRLAEILIENETESRKPDSERKASYRKENEERLKNAVNNLYNNLYPELEERIFAKILTEASKHPETKILLEAGNIKNPNAFTVFLYENTMLKEREKYMELLKSGNASKANDPYINYVIKLKAMEAEYDKKMTEIQGKLNILIAQYMDARRHWLDKSFIPDANSTLRLTFGYIRGYSPADATSYYPVTTVRGIIEKGREEGDYEINKKLVELYRNKDFGRFKDPKLNDVPVGILYNTDTSGGNSGSPVLDAYGRLVGVNFDRAFEATINDYAWSEDYSRSIGVDIRFILWVTQKIGGADYLLKEMGVL
jgi:hypothetical protein